MILYKCDRCGRMIEPELRYVANVLDEGADLCPQCFQDYVKLRAVTEKQYKKQLKAIMIQFGMINIKEALDNGKIAEK